MLGRTLILFLFILAIIILLGLYLYKTSAHFRYLRIKAGKSPGSWADFIKRNFIFKNDDQRWKEAWLIFPLLFGVEVEDTDKPAEIDVKSVIRQANILIYLALIVAMILVVYASKAYPEGIF